MPRIGERKTKNGITGEWNGTTWVRVDSSPDAGAVSVGAPRVGERKTKDGITGEWNGTTWIRVDDVPPQEDTTIPGADLAKAGAKAVAGATAYEATPTVAAHGIRTLATNPTAQKAVGRALSTAITGMAGGTLGAPGAVAGLLYGGTTTAGERAVKAAAKGAQRLGEHFGLLPTEDLWKAKRRADALARNTSAPAGSRLAAQPVTRMGKFVSGAKNVVKNSIPMLALQAAGEANQRLNSPEALAELERLKPGQLGRTSPDAWKKAETIGAETAPHTSVRDRILTLLGLD